MKELSQTLLDFVKDRGTCEAGIATVETLAGGPPSVDLSYLLPQAKSAVVFAIPLDQSLIPPYLMKKDRSSHAQNYLDSNVIADGIAMQLASYLKQKGYQSVPVDTNGVYRGGVPEPTAELCPDISHRYLAVRAGVGYFGLSGNVLTKNHGPAVALGSVVTTAELQPTEPLPKEENYCDECRLCMASCLSGLMDHEQKTTVTMGGVDFSYSKRRAHCVCTFVCGGFTGLHPSGKWSTWSPGRFEVPKNNKEFIPALVHAMGAWQQWPAPGKGFHIPLLEKKVWLTCGNCALVCHPDKEERKKRYKMLTENGVVIQYQDGSLKAVSPEAPNDHLSSMAPEVRALYEGVVPSDEDGQ